LPIRLSSFRQRRAGKIFSLPAPQQGSGRESCGIAPRPCSAGTNRARSSCRHTSPASRNSYALIVAPGWRSLDLWEGAAWSRARFQRSKSNVRQLGR
jgi:hypothetical protein